MKYVKLIWVICFTLFSIEGFAQGVIRHPVNRDTSRSKEAPPAPRPNAGKRTNNIKVVTDSNFDDFIALSYSKPVIIDFYADWCAPCRKMAPMISNIAKRYGNELAVGRYDTDNATGKNKEYGFFFRKKVGVFNMNVDGVPNIYFIRNGRIIEQQYGSCEEKELVMITEKFLHNKGNIEKGYVDLGLPSGTLWKDANESNEPDWSSIHVPSREQWEELVDNCTKKWTGSGLKFTGPNGNSIILPLEKQNDGNYCLTYRSSDYDPNFAGTGAYVMITFYKDGKSTICIDCHCLCSDTPARLVQNR